MNDTEPGADGAQSRRERLSALMDGELDVDAMAGCCLQWRDDTDVRTSWHAYHLIGDVLRSERTACAVSREARLLQAVRRRLADEPVVLAPSMPAPSRSRSRGWLASAAVVAGFMAVAGVVGTIQGSPTSPALSVASTGSQGAAPATPQVVGFAGPVTVATPPDKAPPVAFADGGSLRDERLDRYLTAHKQFGGSSALGTPSGFLRSATLQAPAR